MGKKRFFDDRLKYLSFIQNTIQAAFNLIQLLSKNNGISDQELARTIIRDIGLAKIGINNLKTTYSEDTFFCCSVDTYVETVGARLLDLKSKLPNLFVEDEEAENGEKLLKTD